MKVGDVVKYTSENVPTTFPIGVIVAVGFGKEFTDVNQSPVLHPDIWVITNGSVERWNEKYSRVIDESR